MFDAKIQNNRIVRYAYKDYLDSSMHDLYDAYNSFSENKYNAYRDCKTDMSDNNGHDFKIIRAGVRFFSCGFLYEKDGRQIFRYHTKSYARDYIIGEAV